MVSFITGSTLLTQSEQANLACGEFYQPLAKTLAPTNKDNKYFIKIQCDTNIIIAGMGFAIDRRWPIPVTALRCLYQLLA
ncbi:hypothetical protein [Shewanella cyperi]|uniref:hypothetical protein n=1 Tax=Shewanella cyperi TaxID=2814292 RepID=UPI001A94820D|nr:hypothetical protein [Shewanella cyperi]QSX39285.1 hypothetical protein JYB84_09410 [Shewanella cyperi]